MTDDATFSVTTADAAVLDWWDEWLEAAEDGDGVPSLPIEYLTSQSYVADYPPPSGG